MKSGTRREDLLLNKKELEATNIIHRDLVSYMRDDRVDSLISLFIKTRNNDDLVEQVITNKGF